MAHRSRFAILVLTLCLSAFILSPRPAQALSLQVNGSGILTGATDVNVGGNLYNVQFLDGTCAALFNGCDQVTDFTFQSQAAAIQAGQALVGQVYPGAFDDSPELIQGCSSTFFCSAVTPYALFPGSPGAFAVFAVNYDPTFNGTGENGLAVSSLNDSTGNISSTWARWTPAAANPVPEPATITLFGLGLGALVLWDYRRRQERRRGV